MKKRRSRVRLHGSDMVLMTVIYTVGVLLCLSIIFPFLIIFFQSVTPTDAMHGAEYVLVPERFDFSAYKYLLIDSGLVLNGMKNSAFLVVAGGGFALLLTTLYAYMLSKKYLPYRRFLTYLVYIPMLFGGGLVPTFMMVKFVGLYGSLWACVFPGAVATGNIFLMRNFFMELPTELEEAAMLDGANDVRIMVSVALPISLPAIATFALFYGVGKWNEWFAPALYLKTNDQWPMQLVVRQMLSTMNLMYSDNLAAMEDLLMNMPSDNVKKAAVFIATIPVLLFYPFAQKYFVEGLVAGSIKG